MKLARVLFIVGGGIGGLLLSLFTMAAGHFQFTLSGDGCFFEGYGIGMPIQGIHEHVCGAGLALFAIAIPVSIACLGCFAGARFSDAIESRRKGEPRT